MPEPNISADDVISRARDTLEVVRLGLEDLFSYQANRKPIGLRNVVVFGRTVTIIVQNLRTPVGKARFDAWYEPYLEEMKQDPLMRFMIDLRNDIEKRGQLGIASSSMNISHMDVGEVIRAQSAPPGATSFFMGDHLGGSGWVVPQPDGTEEKYYVDLSGGYDGRTMLHFADPPTIHLGATIQNTSIEDLCRLYYDYLVRFVDAAEEEFAAK